MGKSKTIALFLCLFNINLFAQEGLEISTEPYIEALYRGCGKEIKIISPVISQKDNITYSCIGADLLRNENDNRLITVVPYSVYVNLKLYKDSILIGEKKFKVRLIPKPTIKIYADSNLVENIDQSHEHISKATNYFTVKARPDERLLAYSPYDARYTVVFWKIILVREDKEIDSLSFTTETGNIISLLSKLNTGDNLHIEVYKVIRKNFLNRTEELQLGVITKVIQIE